MSAVVPGAESVPHPPEPRHPPPTHAALPHTAASPDDTADRLREAASLGFPLRALRHRRSCGQSAAIVTGVRAARGLWIATLDGDGQNDPADIPRLLARARAEDPEAR